MDLQRFIAAQTGVYTTALEEIKAGRKRSHWMWYIFPQLKGLGYSETARFYSISDIKEAGAYLNHPVLGPRLVETSAMLLKLQTNNAGQVFGSPDDMKLRSSMTLFSAVPGTNPVFSAVLDKFFNGAKDNKTLDMLRTG